jgi:hypothetical protein
VTEVMTLQAHDGDDSPPPPPWDERPFRDLTPDDPKSRKEKQQKEDDWYRDDRRRSSRNPGSDPSDSSSSDGERRDRRRRRREVSRDRRPRSPKLYRVRSEKLVLGTWPTNLQFAEWKRNLRSEIAAASDRPIEATAWIFEVERASQTMDNMASNPNDPFRALDAKLQAALQKVTKGEQSRKLAILQEELALSDQLISGRQHLLFVYFEFAKDAHKTDAVAYQNLEKIAFANSGDEAALEEFLTLWDGLLMSFNKPPSDDHLYAAFHSRIKGLPGLKIVIDHLDRIDYGHDDKSYDYLMSAARRLVDKRRLDRQTLEFSKVYSGRAQTALAAGTVVDGKSKKGGGKGDKKVFICYAMRDNGSCALGENCPYSHDPEKIKADKGKGKGKGSKTLCRDFLAGNCPRGAACTWSHERAAPAAPAAPAASAEDEL